MPFFGLIGLGFVAARLSDQSVDALGWLSTFIVYFALPALFFSLLSETPVQMLTRWDFILTNMSGISAHGTSDHVFVTWTVSSKTFSPVVVIGFLPLFALPLFRSEGSCASSPLADVKIRPEPLARRQ